MQKTFFTTGQFANICETTKETLRHYNKIGLLKPIMKGNNGYQYYSYRQICDFYLINNLKNTGCSLNKVSEYITDDDNIDFRNLLESQLEQVLIEKSNIEKREQIIKYSIKKYDLLKKYKRFNTCYVEEETKDRYFIITLVDEAESYEECMKSINNHFRYCNCNDLNVEYQLTYICIGDKKTKEKKSYVASEIYDNINDDRLHIKSKGRYIKYICKGQVNKEVIYKEVDEFAKKNKLLIEGYTYESEISFYKQSKEDDYITEISVKIQ